MKLNSRQARSLKTGRRYRRVEDLEVAATTSTSALAHNTNRKRDTQLQVAHLAIWIPLKWFPWPRVPSPTPLAVGCPCGSHRKGLPRTLFNRLVTSPRVVAVTLTHLQEIKSLPKGEHKKCSYRLIFCKQIAIKVTPKLALFMAIMETNFNAKLVYLQHGVI